METLPPIGNTHLNGELIIVEVGTGFALGVKALKPGATMIIENAGRLVPKFAGRNPLSICEKRNGKLVCEIGNTCDAGTFPFAMTEDNQVPNTFPYAIHVREDGAPSALLREVKGKLRVVVTVTGEPGRPISVGFVKEAFSAEVVLKTVSGGQVTERVLPEANATGLWQGIAPSAPARFTFTVGGVGSLGQLRDPNAHSEVVGSDEGDLDIVPPPPSGY